MLSDRKSSRPGNAMPVSGREDLSSHADIREFFNTKALEWDLVQDIRTVRSSEGIVRSLPIEKGSRVLDAGCGTGVLIPWLMEAVGSRGSVCALDIAENMLECARRKFAFPNLFYIHADMAHTPFLDGFFDLVICHNCFPHVAEKRAAVGEMFRILRPGGLAVISHAESREEINARHRRIGGPVAADMLPDGMAMRRLFLDAGFENISIRDDDDGYMLQAGKPAAVYSAEKSRSQTDGDHHRFCGAGINAITAPEAVQRATKP